MSVQPLIRNAANQNPYSSIQEAERDISQLERTALCTMGLSKLINCCFLPISIPCYACVEICTDQAYGYDTDAKGRCYSRVTSCHNPFCQPKTSNPNYELPNTHSDIIAKDLCDPCANCLCCNQESLTNHYLTTPSRDQYAQAKQYQRAHNRLLGQDPPQVQIMELRDGVDQAMQRDPQIVQIAADGRESALMQVFKKMTGKDITLVNGPIDRILELAGPVKVHQPVVIHHPRQPRPKSSPRRVNIF